MFSLFYKKIIGRKLIDIIKPILVAVILYLSLSNLKYVAYSNNNILKYFAFVFCSGIVFKLVNENEYIFKLSEILMLPISKLSFNYSYLSVLILYAIATKLMPVVAIIFAFGSLSLNAIISTVVFAINGSIAVYLCKGYLSARKIFTSILVFAVNLANVLLVNSLLFALATMFIMLICVLFLNPYWYLGGYQTSRSKQIKYNKRNSLVILRCFIRYMLDHKIYLTNTIVLYGLSIVLPMFLKDLFPICLAILSVNTPIGIFISSQKGLGDMLDVLPSQKKKFMFPYAMICLTSSLIANIIAVVSNYVIGELSFLNIFLAIVFAFINTLIIATLEAKYRIKNFNVESDLWHNPRKYISPAILFVIASVVVILIN